VIGKRGGLARLGREVDAAMTGHEVEVPGGHVYHVALSVPPADSNVDAGFFGDARWRDLVESAIEHMGFGANADGHGGCRWVAVHHGLSIDGNDHVHLVLNLVQGDGRIANTYRDWPRWRAWCRMVEERYDLTRTGAADRTATPRVTRGENEKARRLGQRVPARDRLRRITAMCAVASTSFDEFREQLAAYQVQIRIRRDHLGRPTGYAVTDEYDPGCRTAKGKLVYFGGAALAPEFSLPKLQHRWAGARAASPEPGLPAAADAVRRAGHAIAAARTHEKRLWQEGAEGVAHATGDLLLGLCRAVGPEQRGLLVRVWETYAVAARVPHQVVPNRWNLVARELHGAARWLLATSARPKDDDTVRAADIVALVLAVSGLIAEIAAWREAAQQRRQASSARRAVDLLSANLAGNPPTSRAVQTADPSQAPKQRGLPSLGHPLGHRGIAQLPGERSAVGPAQSLHGISDARRGR